MAANSTSFLDDLDMSDLDQQPRFDSRMAAVCNSMAAVGADLSPWQPFAAGSQAAEVVETIFSDRELSPPLFDQPKKGSHISASSMASLDDDDDDDNDSWCDPPVDHDLPDTTLPHWQQSREEAEGSLPLLPLPEVPRSCRPRRMSDMDEIPEVAESVVSAENLRRRNYIWSHDARKKVHSFWSKCTRNRAKGLYHRHCGSGKIKPGEGSSLQASRPEQIERTAPDERSVAVERNAQEADKMVEADEDETDDETYTERPRPLANKIFKDMWKSHKKPRYVLESIGKSGYIWKSINGQSAAIRYISPRKLRTRHARQCEAHSE